MKSQVHRLESNIISDISSGGEWDLSGFEAVSVKASQGDRLIQLSPEHT